MNQKVIETRKPANLRTRNTILLVLVIGFLPWFGFSSYATTLNEEEYTSVSILQTSVVTGQVTDALSSEPLPGVSVFIKGTSQGTTTDAGGTYSLGVNSTSDILVFSYIGYETFEVLVGTQKVINVQLVSAMTELDEIVVVGYGTQRRGDITSSVASVNQKDFQKGSVRDAAQLIAGRTAGLRVGVTSGDPTAGTEISLRGFSTVYGISSPLVIIDGIPGSLSTVSPEDIESIDILKDGSAAAIYGTRGTNGVILITTRKAKKNTSTVDYNSYVAIQSIARQLDFLDASDYQRLIGQGVDFIDHGYDTDWLSEVTRANPVSHNHNLTVMGSSENSSYTGSFSLLDTEGLFLKSDNQDYRLRLDATHSMFNNKLKVNINLLTRQQTYWTGGDGYSFNSYVYRQALIRNPTDRPLDDNGKWIERDIYFYDNPSAYIQETDGEFKRRSQRLSGSIIYQPIKDVNIKLLVSKNSNNSVTGFYQTKNHVSTTKYGKNGFASRGSTASDDKLLEFTTDYNITHDNHRITALGGYSFQESMYDNFWMQNWDFPTDNYTYNNMGSGNALIRGEAPISSYRSMNKLIGFFGRLNYNFDDRYLLMASVRREGSSKFGANHKWGTFPSVSAGWRLSKESFMQSVEVLNNLMLRVGYGVTGTEPADPYMSLTTLSYADRFYYQGKWIQGLTPAQNPNPDLRWEKKEEYNIGVEFSLLNHRISGSLDLYKRHTSDMLWWYTVPTPPFLYSSMLANVGETENKGIEAFIRLVPFRTKDFEWGTNISYSTNNMKLLSLSNDTYSTDADFFYAGHTGEPIQKPTHRVEIGGPIGNFWGWKVVDIDDNGRWVVEKPDGTLTTEVLEDDRQVLGNGIPKHVLSWNHQLSYKNFDLDISMRGAFGFQILNFTRMYYENPNITQYNMLASAWDDVYGKGLLKSPLTYTSYYIENGDYWKIDNIALGYNFKTQNVKFINSARVYIAAQNCFTITGYKGIDPEVSFTGLYPGNDSRDKYPTTRTFTFGVNLKF